MKTSPTPAASMATNSAVRKPAEKDRGPLHGVPLAHHQTTDRTTFNGRERPMFCLECLSQTCDHVKAHQYPSLPVAWFTPREMKMLAEILKPTPATMKEKAAKLGITEGTMKVYTSTLYRKLRWPSSHCSLARLTLWVAIHHKELGLELPTPAEFHQLG